MFHRTINWCEQCFVECAVSYLTQPTRSLLLLLPDCMMESRSKKKVASKSTEKFQRFRTSSVTGQSPKSRATMEQNTNGIHRNGKTTAEKSPIISLETNLNSNSNNIQDNSKSMPEANVSDKVRQCLAKHNYSIVRFIDHGSTSMVYKVLNRDGKYMAAKVIDHSKISEMILTKFLPNELAIVRNIQHPYIVYAENVLSLPDYSIIVSEYATDGDLITYIEKLSSPNILLSKRWFLQITQALVYLHNKGIAHRDIKADNILLCSGSAKLADFGYAQYCIDPNTGKTVPCTTYCGTLEYKAPETLMCNAPFDAFIADCFSMGVLLYTMVTLQFPFGTGPEIRSTSGIQYLYSDIIRKRWSATDEIKSDQKLQSLLKQMLTPDVDERITAAQILSHPWLCRK